MAPAMIVRMLSVGKRLICLMPERPALRPAHEVGDALSERGDHAVAGDGDDRTAEMILSCPSCSLSSRPPRSAPMPSPRQIPAVVTAMRFGGVAAGCLEAAVVGRPVEAALRKRQRRKAGRGRESGRRRRLPSMRPDRPHGSRPGRLRSIGRAASRSSPVCMADSGRRRRAPPPARCPPAGWSSNWRGRAWRSTSPGRRRLWSVATPVRLA